MPTTNPRTTDPAAAAAMNRSRLFELETHNAHGERVRRSPGTPARRILLQPLVTEMASVLEPVCRDPFMDSPELVARSRQPRRARVADVRCRRADKAPNRR